MIFVKMKQAAELFMQKIHQHPFNVELSQGRLPQEKFIHYLTQDALYLTDFSKALALVAARLNNNEHTQRYIEFALAAIQAEQRLHHQYLAAHTQLACEKAEQSPACFMYTQFLLRMASLASVEEAVASLLPCFWIYQEVGEKIFAQQQINNPYQEWINLYASAEYERSVHIAIEITNQLAREASDSLKNKMITAFTHSTRLEWLFWDSAYCQQKWPA